MKILHIIETLNLGGAENVVADLSNSMVNDHDIVVCCIKEMGVIASRISPRIQVDCLEKGEGNSIRLVSLIYKYIKQIKPDIVHLHSLGTLLEVSIVLAFYRKSIFIVTCHGYLSHYSKNKLKRSIRRMLEIPAFLLADKIVTVSRELENILPWPISKKVRTILNGVNIGIEPINRTHGKDVIDLIYAGRLAKVKNLGCVVHAIKQIENKIDVKLRFQILGVGPEDEFLKKLVRDLDVKTEINFIGYVGDVRSWYRSSDIFILPSYYEGISIALLEAMAEALAVIVTNVGGNSEIVTHDVSGIVVEVNNVNELADAITKLAGDNEFRRYLQVNGFNTVKKQFNLEAATWRYLQLYQGYDK